MQFGGIVLCGGKSSRMGQSKAWLPFGGEPLLCRVVRVMRQAVDPVAVVAAVGQALPELPQSVLIVRDDFPERGPLQGIATGLRSLMGRCDAAYVSSCDAPFLRADFIQTMVAYLGDHLICMPQAGGYLHPLAAVYRMDVLDAVEEFLRQEQLRPANLVKKMPSRIVNEDELKAIDPRLDSLRNLNRPEDYERALADLAANSL